LSKSLTSAKFTTAWFAPFALQASISIQNRLKAQVSSRLWKRISALMGSSACSFSGRRYIDVAKSGDGSCIRHLRRRRDRIS